MLWYVLHDKLGNLLPECRDPIYRVFLLRPILWY